VREVGLLDEAYFMYGEDLDWAYRIKQYGWKIMYVPSAIVHHYKRASSRQRPFRSIRAFYDAMRVFHRKHYAATTPAPLNLLIEAGITLKEYLSLGRNLIRPAAARHVG
jgi:GT2 family glycosyltransferase